MFLLLALIQSYIFRKTDVPEPINISKVPVTGRSQGFQNDKSTDLKDVHHCSKKCENDPEDIELSVQKEEWLEFLRQTIHNVMLGDVDVLVEKHSLKLIMNAFNTCYTCPVVVTTVARLLSLPFVAESVPENNMKEIKQVRAANASYFRFISLLGQMRVK